MPFKKYKKDSEYSYALGITLTFELLKFKPEDVLRVYVHSKINKNENFNKLLELCKNTNTEVIYSDKPFNVLSEKENTFVIGVFKKFDSELERNKSHIVLVNPSNAGNIGTIMRSALGFGINNMAIIRPAVDIFEPKAVRASMGALFSMNIRYFESFDEYLNTYKTCKIDDKDIDRELYPFMLKAKISAYELKPEGTFSLIFGNEATGLPDEFLEIGTPVIIPISNKIDSLNLPIAASIALYQAGKNV
ncbi:MAG: TrmH family RNA methyltransferase [Lachnospiraceae bacterium]|nr:TrmH family RNA methyltransferase [Lachnospiraceae bacterium]